MYCAVLLCTSQIGVLCLYSFELLRLVYCACTPLNFSDWCIVLVLLCTSQIGVLCLYSFLFETLWGRRLGAKTCRIYFDITYSVWSYFEHLLLKVNDFIILFSLLKGTHLRYESGRNFMLTTYLLLVPRLGLPGTSSEILHTCPFYEARTMSPRTLCFRNMTHIYRCTNKAAGGRTTINCAVTSCLCHQCLCHMHVTFVRHIKMTVRALSALTEA